MLGGYVFTDDRWSPLRFYVGRVFVALFAIYYLPPPLRVSGVVIFVGVINGRSKPLPYRLKSEVYKQREIAMIDNIYGRPMAAPTV